MYMMQVTDSISGVLGLSSSLSLYLIKKKNILQVLKNWRFKLCRFLVNYPCLRDRN